MVHSVQNSDCKGCSFGDAIANQVATPRHGSRGTALLSSSSLNCRLSGSHRYLSMEPAALLWRNATGESQLRPGFPSSRRRCWLPLVRSRPWLAGSTVGSWMHNACTNSRCGIISYPCPPEITSLLSSPRYRQAAAEL